MKNKHYDNQQILNIINIWRNNKSFISLLTSEEMFFIINSGYNQNINDLLERDFNEIIKKVMLNFNLCDLLTIFSLIQFNINKGNCMDLLKKSVFEVFDKNTIFFIKNIYSELKEKRIFEFNEINRIIYERLDKKTSIESTKILIDLYHLEDFKERLKKDYPTVEYIIKKNIEAEPFAQKRELVLGKSIIGKLVKDNNADIIKKEFKILQNLTNANDEEIKIIGAGSCSIVFQVGNYVLKIGEKRNNRKIFINHRILASKNRKLHLDRHGNESFYTETMRFAEVGTVTPEERDELVSDLRRQGIIWDDTKLENCGVLMPDDSNEWAFEGDYDEEIAGVIDNPVYKEQFSKRKRRIVVIDNDNMKRDPKSFWK